MLGRFATSLCLLLLVAPFGAASDGGGEGRLAMKGNGQTLADGRETFRFDTFGDEAFWGDALGLHQAIQTRTPREVLGLGLKVDADALPRGLIKLIRRGKVDLDDPAVTLLLLRANAVVGVTGFFAKESDSLRSIGIQCALCHSTVDDSVAPGIGRRLDGWANRDLDVGKVINLAPRLTPFSELLQVPEATVRQVLTAWGPGRFDAELALDGKGFRPDGRTSAVLIPPAFGLAGVNLHTWTGFGSVPYWNAFVAVLEMHGQGNFSDARLANAARFPVAARAGFADVRSPVDRVTPKLADLHAYQLSLDAPAPPKGSFDAAAAARGKALFSGKADCARCHVPPLYTEPGWDMRTPAEVGVDTFQADRSPDGRYRTSPLRGLWTHQKGGFFHDGRFATLLDVVNHYDAIFALGLSGAEKSDLVEFMKSL